MREFFFGFYVSRTTQIYDWSVTLNISLVSLELWKGWNTEYAFARFIPFFLVVDAVTDEPP